ncbi:MAG: 2'-deoxycytidine 5'-triphosphate deaminase, partial [Pseudomonadota bacterium]
MTEVSMDGVIPSQELDAMIATGAIAADTPIERAQLQPASIDLRLGRRAWRVRASFLPGPRPVAERLADYAMHEIDLAQGAVLEKGWLGGGNTGRNTTIIRSNYLQPGSAAIYELSRSLYEDLSQQLNFNIMFSPRGVLMLGQTEHELRAWKRTAHANRLAGIESEMVTPARVKELAPIINIDGPRYPVLGGLWQARGGTARHDAVAWGYARAASSMGVDIVQRCEVTGVDVSNGKVMGVQTSRGPITCDKLCIVVAGHSGVLADMAGFRLPVESVALQALVSEPIKPVLDIVVMANTVHGYMS